MSPSTTILMIDDDPNARTMVASLLAAEPYRLIFAADGAEGLRLAAAQLPDVVLSDVVMPGLDGFEVCRRLRADARLAEVPILLLTVLSDRASCLKGLEAGADDFLSKPFDQDEMIARLRVITRLNRYRHLLAERHKFQQFVESTSDGIVLCDEESRVTEWNPALEAIVGVTRAHAVGRPLWEILAPAEALPGETTSVAMVAAPGFPLESSVRHPDGTDRTLEISAFLIPSEAGFRLGAIVRDLTERKRAQQTLAQEQERMQALMDLSPDAIYFKDAQSRFTRINRALASQFNLTDPEEAIGRTDSDFFMPEHAQAARNDEQHILETGEPLINREEKETWADRPPTWVSTTKTPLRNAAGAVIGLFGISRDITDRKQAEIEHEHLFQAERQQRQLAESLIDVGAVLVAESNPDTLIRRVLDLVSRVIPNDTANIMLLDAHQPRLAYVRRPRNVEAETYLARLNLSVATLPNLQRMAESGLSVVVPDTNADPDWVRRPETDWIRAYAGAPIRAGGKLIGFLNVNSATPGFFGPHHARLLQAFADQAAIALENAHLFAEARRRADGQTLLSRVALGAAAGEAFDATIAQATAALKQLWPEASLGFLFVDEARVELRPHPAYQGLPTNSHAPIPLSRGLLGWAIHEQQSVRVDDVLADARYVARLAETRSEMIAPLVVTEAGQNRVIGAINVESSQFAAFSEEDLRLLTTLAGQLALLFEKARLDTELAAYAATLEQRVKERTLELEALNSELHQAKREADRANQAKSEFLSRMSHELRTPLNAILGFAQIMEMDELGGEIEDNVKQISRAGRHLLTLIDEVLDIARVEAGRLSIALESVPVGRLVQEVLDLVQPLAAKRQIALRVDRQPENWQVQADPQRLKQVLLNLLSNAIKYNREAGTVTVEVIRDEREAQVSPNAGAPLVVAWFRFVVRDTGRGLPPDKLSRLFTPFDRLGAEQTDVPGTGLGLAFSKNLVEAMNGIIGVESLIGQGSTFWVELPASRAPAEIVKPETEPLGTLSRPVEKNRTVLYIEDNLQNRTLIEKILARRGTIRLISSMQGQLGLDLAREHHPDLILLDLHLPDLPGDQILLALQADEQTQGIPVVMVSADALPGQIDRLLASGARAYLTKPLDVRRFIQVVDEILGEAA